MSLSLHEKEDKWLSLHVHYVLGIVLFLSPVLLEFSCFSNFENEKNQVYKKFKKLARVHGMFELEPGFRL